MTATGAMTTFWPPCHLILPHLTPTALHPPPCDTPCTNVTNAARPGKVERKDLGAGPAAETYEDNLWQITDQPDGSFVIENC